MLIPMIIDIGFLLFLVLGVGGAGGVLASHYGLKPSCRHPGLIQVVSVVALIASLATATATGLIEWLARERPSAAFEVVLLLGATTMSGWGSNWWSAAYTARKLACGRCIRCGYSLTGLPTRKCPECGTDNT